VIFITSGRHGTRSNCNANRNAITALNYDRPHIDSKTSNGPFGGLPAPHAQDAQHAVMRNHLAQRSSHTTLPLPSPILLRLALHRWRTNSGSLAMFATIRHASARAMFSEAECELSGTADALCSVGPLDRPIHAIEPLGRKVRAVIGPHRVVQVEC
jgi:hypothetical protein